VISPDESIEKSALPVPDNEYETVSDSGSIAGVEPTTVPKPEPCATGPNEYDADDNTGGPFEVEIDTGAVSDPPVADAVTVNE